MHAIVVPQHQFDRDSRFTANGGPRGFDAYAIPILDIICLMLL
jgi:hypothetical protein